MSNLVFDTMIAKESNAQGELLHYARRAVDERDALSKEHADQCQLIADLREGTDILRRQLDEARSRVTELSGTPISARVFKTVGNLDYLLQVASIRVIAPGYFEVRLA